MMFRHMRGKENSFFFFKAEEGMRDALSLLDQSIAYGNGKVLTADVKTMLGTIGPSALLDILNALNQQDGSQLLAAINTLSSHGVDFSNALSALLSLLHQITVIQAVPGAMIENDC